MTTLEGGSPEGSDVEPATTAHEVPVYLAAGPEHVFGILTRPTVTANGTAVLCLHAGAQNLTSHRNRMYTRLCREVAGAGYTAFRMDFHGTGDSSGVLVDRSLSEQTLRDVDLAVRWLVEQGAKRVVVVGTCWGGLVALAAAARHDEVASACLISPPLRLVETGADATQRGHTSKPLGHALRLGMHRDVLRMLLAERQYRRWVVSRVVGRVTRRLPKRTGARDGASRVEVSAQGLFAPLLRRRVPIRVLFGEQDPTYLGLVQHGPLPSLEAASGVIDMTVTPVTVHGLTTLRAQEAALEFVKDCLARDEGRVRPTASGRAGLLVDDEPGELTHIGEVVRDDLLVGDHDAEHVLEVAREFQEVGGVEDGR
jgi:pimeloyl-ACP methyl ester carboxylesterase